MIFIISQILLIIGLGVFIFMMKWKLNSNCNSNNKKEMINFTLQVSIKNVKLKNLTFILHNNERAYKPENKITIPFNNNEIVTIIQATRDFYRLSIYGRIMNETATFVSVVDQSLLDDNDDWLTVIRIPVYELCRLRRIAPKMCDVIGEQPVGVLVISRII